MKTSRRGFLGTLATAAAVAPVIAKATIDAPKFRTRIRAPEKQRRNYDGTVIGVAIESAKAGEFVRFVMHS